MAEFKSPSGWRIIGTLEQLPGIALTENISDTGVPFYSGQTDIDWNRQESVYRNNQLVYVDENHDEWTFDQLVKVED